MCALLSSKQEHKDALSHAEKGAEMCQGIVAGFERNGSTASPLYLRACTLMGVSYHNLGVQLEILQDKSACAWYDKGCRCGKKVLPVDDSMRIHIVRAAQEATTARDTDRKSENILIGAPSPFAYGERFAQQQEALQWLDRALGLDMMETKRVSA